MKKVKVALASVVLSLSMSMISLAGSWQQNETGYWWQNDDGSFPANTWQWLDGNNDGIAESYYFNENGYCLMNTTIPDGYTVDANGAWIVNGVVQTQGTATQAQAAPTNTTTPQTETAPTGISSTPYDGYTIIVNTNTKKYHTPGCRFVSQMNASNTGYSSDAAILEAQGYSACKICH